jgi:polysaccharide chain length determinant protein (PEP-CTERM system associated)
MRETFSALLTQIRKVWLNRRFAFPVALAVALVGWTVVAALPDVYEGSATLYVDTKSLLNRVLDRVAIDTEELDAEFVALARQRLLSRPNIERLARETDLDLGANNPERMDQLLNEISSTIDISTASTSGASQRGARPNIFVLKVRHQNPEIAGKMIRSLVTIFGESVVGQNRDSNDQTERFLNEQISEYQQRLDETERRLMELRRVNSGALPGEGSNVYDDLQTNRSLLEDAQRELGRAMAQQSAIRRQLGVASGASSASVSSDVANKLEQWTRLNTQLQTLLGQYTDQHPQVVAVRKRIEELNFDPASVSNAGVPIRSTADPGALQFELFRVESEVAAQRERVSTYAARVAALESSLVTLPESEAQVQALTRDYDIHKSQYNALVQRRESARLSREAELTTNQVQFQVIEPPRVSSLPVEPKRGLLLTTVLLAAFGIAGGIGFLMAQINPTFGDVRELEAATGLSAYGSVGAVRNAHETRTHRIEYLAYIAIFLGMLVTYVGLVAWLADDFKSLLR